MDTHTRIRGDFDWGHLSRGGHDLGMITDGLFAIIFVTVAIEQPFLQILTNSGRTKLDSIAKRLITLFLASSIAACGQTGKKEDAVSDRNTQVISHESTVGGTLGLFDPVESKMGEQMKSAVGVDVGDNWVRKMIAHHQGAIDMSKIVLEQKPTAEVAKMARMTIDKQGDEIKDLTKLEEKGASDNKSALLYQPAMVEMQTSMMGATGTTISDTYLRKMLAHHEGAVAMSDIALKNGVRGLVKSRVEKTKGDQQKEADTVKGMIANSSM